jgi:hypothetical protein
MDQAVSLLAPDLLWGWYMGIQRPLENVESCYGETAKWAGVYRVETN